MVAQQEKQPFNKSIVAQIRNSKSAEELCNVVKTLLGMFIPREHLLWVRNTLEQKVTEFGLWRDVPKEIEQARTALGSEKNTPEQSVP